MMVHGGPATWLLFRQTIVVFKHGVEQHSGDDNGKFVMLMRAAIVETCSCSQCMWWNHGSSWCVNVLCPLVRKFQNCCRPLVVRTLFYKRQWCLCLHDGASRIWFIAWRKTWLVRGRRWWMVQWLLVRTGLVVAALQMRQQHEDGG